MAMKYIKPETKTIKVELQQMIAESIPTCQNLGDGQGFTFGAKGFSFEEIEEEEEE